MTTVPASLKREAGKSLKDIVVVPNPFSITAGLQDLQFGGEPNLIRFMNIPYACKIKIYTESGDLVSCVHNFL